MPDEEQQLCDGCHERPATFHTTCGENAQTQNLCATCWEQLASADELATHRRFREAIATGRCKYCGSPAAGGSFSGGFMATGEQANLWCEPCRADFSEFVSRPENIMPDDVPDDEA